MPLTEKLSTLREKVKKANKFDDDFRRLVGIELFDFIQRDVTLKNEFDRRFNYLEKLKSDRDFNRLQDNLFGNIQDILKFTSNEGVEKRQKEWKNAFANYLKMETFDLRRQKVFLELPELYSELQSKSNFYRLGENSPYSPEGEISIRTHVAPVLNQYHRNVRKFFQLIFNEDYIKKLDKKASSKLDNLLKQYDDYWFKLDEVLYRVPISLHFHNFEEFFLDCIKFHPRPSYEWYYDFFSSSDKHAEDRFEKIKENALVVIDDLNDVIKTNLNTEIRNSSDLKKIVKIKQLEKRLNKEFKEVDTDLGNEEKTSTETDSIKAELRGGLLILNKDTGSVTFNGFESSLNPIGQEIKVLSKLMNNKNFQATYKELLDDNISKVTKRNLTFVIRNLKECLGILPADKARNEDCIKNIKNFGYKLITIRPH